MEHHWLCCIFCLSDFVSLTLFIINKVLYVLGPLWILEDSWSTSGGVNILFQSRLLVSLEHGLSWDTMTIKTHVPAYMEPCRPCITLFNSVLTRWHWDSLLDFIQVQLKLHTVGFLSSECLWESSLQTCIGQLGTLQCSLQLHSPFLSTYRTFIGIESTCNVHYYYRQQIEAQTAYTCVYNVGRG